MQNTSKRARSIKFVVEQKAENVLRDRIGEQGCGGVGWGGAGGQQTCQPRGFVPNCQDGSRNVEKIILNA